MVKVVPVVPSEGNTKPPKKQKKKQVSPANKWVFTWNNYPENAEELLDSIPSSIVPKMRFQSEIGDGTEGVPDGTPHLQGFIVFQPHVKKRPKGIFKFSDKIHWEAMAKKATVRHNLLYCTKSHTKDGKIDYWRGLKPVFNGPEKHWFWQDWMDEYVEIASKPPAHPLCRDIHWIWDRDGGHGKSAFAQWCYHNIPDTVVTTGKTADMFNGIVNFINKNGYTPSLVLVDIPRCGTVNAHGLEQIKNMFFYSGKYEGDEVSGQRPHVFVFANHKSIGVFSNDKYIYRELI